MVLLAFIQLGSASEARAAPQHAISALEDAGAEPLRTPALFSDLELTSVKQPHSGARYASLPRPAVTEEPGLEWASDGVLRSRQVGVDQSQLAAVRTAMAQGRPGRLRLNLFPDVDLNVGIERTGDTRFGYSLSGRIGGQPHGSVTVVVSGKLLAGVVHSRQGTYTIASRSGAIHTIREITGDRNHDFDGHLSRAAVRGDSGAPSATASVGDDGSEVDLLVLFTEAALAFEGGLPQMRASIDLAVAYANDAYAASGVEFQLNLVAAVQVDHEESTVHGIADLRNQSEDINRLIDPADGYMDEALVLRDRYAADIIHLIGDYPRGSGKASILRKNAADPAAFAVSVSKSLSSRPLLLAHEVGHVMGLLHDRYTVSRYSYPDYTPPAYAHGYVNQRAFDSGAPEESRWHTIMAYNSQCWDAGFFCREVQRFSHPDQRYPADIGDPLGVPGDEPTEATDGPANAVRMLNENRGLYAGFRQSATRCTPSLSEERLEVPASDGLILVEVGAESNCPWTATAFGDFLSVASDPNGRGSGTVSYRVQPNDGAARVGYAVVDGETLSVYQSGRVPPASVCDRTPQVRDAIVAAIGRDCDLVSEFDLLDVAVLDLKGQGITALDAGDFSGLRNLNELQLAQNRLGTIPETAFSGLINLKELGLRSTGLTAVPEAIGGLPSLRRLYFSWNRIGDLRAEAFRGLSELQVLQLDHNRIAALPDGAFSYLRNLRYLHLDGNRITDVRKEMWTGLEVLSRVILRENPLGKLREDAFASLPQLRELNLRRTQLEAVSPRTFSGFPYLSWLNLSANRIDDLTGVAFPGDSIIALYLQGNALQEIPSGMFAGFTSAACTRRQMNLHLEGNPGAPFPLTLELERVDAERSSPGPASVVLRVREGVPWPITVPVIVRKDNSLSSRNITVENGSVESEPFEVASGRDVSVSFGTLPDVPPTYKGVLLVRGESLKLF